MRIIDNLVLKSPAGTSSHSHLHLPKLPDKHLHIQCRPDATISEILTVVVKALGSNAGAVCLDLRAAGADGGELSCHLMIFISKLIARSEGTVRFDDTTRFKLPATPDETFPSDVQLNLADCVLQGLTPQHNEVVLQISNRKIYFFFL